MTSTARSCPLAVLRTVDHDGDIFDHPDLRRGRIMARTQHKTPGLQVWVGPSGVGKTTAAKQLAFECNQRLAERAPNAYGAKYFCTGGDVLHMSSRQMKRGIYAVYAHVVEPLTASQLRNADETLMAGEVAMMLSLTEVQLLIIDEAGTKTVPELRGIASIIDAAIEIGHPLSILLVGMDDLAEKSQLLDVVRTRTRVVLAFDAWNDEHCMQYVLSRAPSLAPLATRGPAQFRTLVAPLIKRTGGVLRDLQTLLPEIEHAVGKGADHVMAVEKAQQWRDASLIKALQQSAANRARLKQALKHA